MANLMAIAYARLSLWLVFQYLYVLISYDLLRIPSVRLDILQGSARLSILVFVLCVELYLLPHIQWRPQSSLINITVIANVLSSTAGSPS